MSRTLCLITLKYIYIHTYVCRSISMKQLELEMIQTQRI